MQSIAVNRAENVLNAISTIADDTHELDFNSKFTHFLISKLKQKIIQRRCAGERSMEPSRI
jgi:hypothetical protein